MDQCTFEPLQPSNKYNELSQKCDKLLKSLIDDPPIDEQPIDTSDTNGTTGTTKKINEGVSSLKINTDKRDSCM